MASQQHIQEPLMLYCDPELCIACKKCERACAGAHCSVPLPEAKKLNIATVPRVHALKTDTIKMALQCRHCANAPCAQACPVGAIWVEETGVVRVNESFCVGCHICAMACPFGCIEIAEEGEMLPDGTYRRAAKKCDLCHDWRAANNSETMACVATCPTKAMQTVSLKEYAEAARKAHLETFKGIVRMVAPLPEKPAKPAKTEKAEKKEETPKKDDSAKK